MDIYDPIGEALGITLMHQSSFTQFFTPSKLIIGIGGFDGKHHTKESKAAISAAHKGKVLSKEHILKIKNSKIGTSHSDEAKQKMRNAKLGKKQTTEHVAAAAATRIGKKKKPYVFKNPIKCEHCDKIFTPGNYQQHIKSKKVSVFFSNYACEPCQLYNSCDN